MYADDNKMIRVIKIKTKMNNLNLDHLMLTCITVTVAITPVR